MKLIIPMAGKDDRLKPHTHTTPKALLHIAGKTLIEHVLDSVQELPIDKVIFIVDQNYPELEKTILKKYRFKPLFILQKERKGVGHAILGAKKYAQDEEIIILFADTLIEADLKKIKKLESEAILWTKEVKDPRMYGVAFLHDGFVTKLIEKPDTPVSDKALVGAYYFKNSKKLFESLEKLISSEIMTHGEYQLTDAIQFMINEGAKIRAENVKIWYDCGNLPNLLETNKYLLLKEGHKVTGTTNTVIIKPVFIEKGAEINNSIIGPNVSIGADTIITNSIISNTIINNRSTIKDALIKDSVVGKQTKVAGTIKKLNIGDSSEIHYS